MGLIDKAKDAVTENKDRIKDSVSGHEESIDQGIDKVADTIDAKTGDKYADQVDKASQFLKDKTGSQGQDSSAQ